MRQDTVAKSRLTLALVAIGAASVLGAGAGVALSLTSSGAKAPAAATALKVSAPATVGPGKLGDVALAAASSHSSDADDKVLVIRAGGVKDKQVKELKEAITKAVLKKFPHSKILEITLHQDAASLVKLVLSDHRVGTVTVGKKLVVGPFHKLPAVVIPKSSTSTPQYQIPSPAVTGTVGGDSALSGHHW